MDSLTLLSQLRAERSELDVTIRTLESRLGSRASMRIITAASGTPKRKGHVWSAAARKAMSAKLRASWKARQSGKKAKK